MQVGDDKEIKLVVSTVAEVEHLCEWLIEEKTNKGKTVNVCFSDSVIACHKIATTFEFKSETQAVKNTYRSFTVSPCRRRTRGAWRKWLGGWAPAACRP